MAFGISARQGRDNSVSTFVSPTQMNFTGGATGLGLADFLTGKIGTMLQGRTSTHHVNGTMIGVYAAACNDTQAIDANEKASLYAAAGIADYWVVDVTGRRVLVHRSPAPDPRQKYGVGYSAVTVLLPGQSLPPLAAPHAPVAAADLLP